MGSKLLMILGFVMLAIGSGRAIDCYMCSGKSGLCPSGSELGELKNCPPQTGRVSMCLKFDGSMKTTSSMSGTPVNTTGVLRTCMNLPEDMAEDRCYQDQEAADFYIRYAAASGGGAPPPGDNPLVVEGSMCYCSTDGCNGVASLKSFFGLTIAAGLFYLLFK